MIHNRSYYVAPAIADLRICSERGFAGSEGGFEQPDYGGEDNL